MFDFLTPDVLDFLNRGYLRGQTAQDRYRQICDRLEKINGVSGFSDTFYNYCSKGWVSFATPVLSNFGTNHGLNASCNMGTVYDSICSIFDGIKELALLSKNGAGTSKNFSKIRARGTPISGGGTSDGILPWIKLYHDTINSVNQSSVRRGYMAAYLSVTHPEILDFLDLCTPGSPVQFITTGVTIPEGWLQSAKNGDSDKRDIWKKILKRRSEMGFPYIIFEKNINENKFQGYKDTNTWLDTSNLCSECFSETSEEKEFVCVLSSVNLKYFDDFKNTDFIYNFRIALDCFVTEYIEKAKKLKGFEKAVKFSEDNRAVGLGVMGFHDYLQSKNVSFGCLEAHYINKDIFSYIYEETMRASRWMAKEWGEPKRCVGYGVRSTENIAIAPTKSTSYIMGMVSQGIEPIKSNCHEKELAKNTTAYKNPNLEKLLITLDKNTEEIWDSIIENNGSVRHLDFLTDHEKKVFATFYEINQMDIITLAAERQKYIDQGQSLNLMFHPETPGKLISDIAIAAEVAGIKSLYYQHSVNAAQEFLKNQRLTCSVCEG